MQALSRALVHLYEAAEHCSIEAYPGEAMRTIRSLVQFDGAVLGAGEVRMDASPDLHIDKAYVYQRDPSILDEYEQVSADDPVTRRFVGGLDRPLCCNALSFYRENKLSALEQFSRKHEMSQLMLFGDPPMMPQAARWVVLYRRQDKRFTRLEEQYLMAIWPHLSRALAMNRASFLERQLQAAHKRAAALISRNGAIEVADPRFRDMLALEWRQYSGNALPDEVLQAWRSGSDYIGARIQISLRAQCEYIVCHATADESFTALTKAERVVGQHFANGYSNKDIARELGISQNTVRSHIAHIYDKLGVHDKAQLANFMGRRADQISRRADSQSLPKHS